MAIYRGTGGSTSTTEQATIDAVNEDAATATTKAAEAATSAAEAASSAASANTARGSAVAAAGSAQNSANSAEDSKDAALAYKNQAFEYKIQAENARDAAFASETNAATSAASATTSAANAISAASEAYGSKYYTELFAEDAQKSAYGAEDVIQTLSDGSNLYSARHYAAKTAADAATAEAARIAAEAAQEAIDGTYLGALSSDPTVDGNGDAVTVGDWYFNSTSNLPKIYDGSAWNTIDPSLAGDSSPQLGGNLDLNSNDITGTGNIDVTGTITVNDHGIGRFLAKTKNTVFTANQYFKVARITLTDQGADYTVTGSLFTSPDGQTELNHEVFEFSVLQQNAFGSDPWIHLHQFRNGQTRNDLGYVIVQNTPSTIVDLYVKVTSGSTVTDFWTNAESFPEYASWLSEETGSTTQPTGWVAGDKYSNWNTSNDGSGSGLDADLLDGNEASAFVAVSGDSMTGNLSFGDNDKAIFGAGSDLQIYHDGSHSYIDDAGTGNLYIRSDTYLALQNSAGTKNYIFATHEGDVGVYYNGSKKLATTSTGIDVTGTVTADGLTVDGNPVINGTSPQLFLQTGATHYNWQIAAQENVSAAFEISSGSADADATNDTYTKRLVVGQSGDISFYEDTGTTAKFFWDASAESLGIGTSSPQEKLHVNDTIVSTPITYANNQDDAYLIASATNYDGSDTNWGTHGFQHRIKSNASGVPRITVDDRNGERFCITSSGRVGIGTDDPVLPLHVEGNIVGGSADFTSGRSLGAKITAYSNSATLEDIDALYLRKEGYNGSTVGIAFGNATGDDSYVGARIKHYRSGSNSNGDLVFETKGDSSVSTTTERMRINSSGNVGIGTSSPAYPLEVRSASDTEISAIRTGSVRAAIGAFASGESRLTSVGTGAYQTFYTGATATERMRIDSSGNVGIGTSSPNAPLTVNGDIKSFDQYNTGTAEIACRISGDSTFGGVTAPHIDFRRWTGGGTNHASGGIAVLNDATMRFYVSYETTNTASNNEVMRIDSSGNLLVGTTTTGSGSVGLKFESSNLLRVVRDGGTPFAPNRKTSDGAIIDLQKDGSSVGSIGANSGDLYIGEGDTGLKFDAEFEAIVPFNTSTLANRDGEIDLGYSNPRFKDLYLSGGVYLGGTGSANHLDDYEEGTFTATAHDKDDEQPTSYWGHSGYYFKIGNIVFFNISISVNVQGSFDEYFKIKGLPFTAKNWGVSNFEASPVSIWSNQGASMGDVLARVKEGTTEIEFSFVTDGSATGGQQCHVQGHYIVS